MRQHHFHLPLQAFSASYDSFSFASSFFALIISTSHGMVQKRSKSRCLFFRQNSRHIWVVHSSVAKGTCKFPGLQNGNKTPVACFNANWTAVDLPLESTFSATWCLHKEFCHNFQWLTIPWQFSTSRLLQSRALSAQKFSHLLGSACNKINEQSWRICQHSQLTRYGSSGLQIKWRNGYQGS